VTDKPNNPPAFPGGWPEAGYEPHYGMTLRDWFAGQALGQAVRDVFRDDMVMATTTPSKLPAIIAKASYQIADAMLAERNRHD
jgi:hypothetical protein